MTTRFYLPHPRLKEYIKGYTISSLGSGTIELIPGGYPAMGMVLDDEFSIEHATTKQQYNYPVHFLGQVTEFHAFATMVRDIVNVVFEPWAPYELFGLPQHDFANTGTDSQLFMTGSGSLLERLKENRHNAYTCVALLNDYFLRLLACQRRQSKIPRDFFRYLTKERGNLTQPEILSMVYMGKTSFHEEFKNVIGISSKMYCRIIRFNQVYAGVLLKDTGRWKEFIYDDYYDQAHFIKEFRHFTADCPSKKNKQAPGLYQNLLRAVGLGK